MNFLMGMMNLLGASEKAMKMFEGAPGWLKTILAEVYDLINSLIVPILIIVATVGIIYSIVLGVNYAKAETSDQKEEAKKRIINVVVGVLLMIVLMMLLWLFINNAATIFGWTETLKDPTQGTGTGRLFFR